VGPIGGIQQKIPGAADAGASVFLVPSANCGEARQAHVEDIRLVRVPTLGSALDSVQKLARDPQASVPTCAP
jgi:PDZ domain-containing protein